MRLLTYILFLLSPLFGFSQMNNGMGCSQSGTWMGSPHHTISSRHTLYNVGGATAAQVSSYIDNNIVFLNGQYLTRLDAQEVFSFNLSIGDSLTACGPIAASGEEGSANVELQPKYTISNTFGTNSSRYDVDLNIYSVDATAARIFKNGVLISTVPLVQNEVAIWTNTGAGKYFIQLDGDGMVYRRENAQANGDPTVVFKPSSEIIGWHSTAAYIAATANSSTFTFTPMDGNIYTGGTSTSYNIVNVSDVGTSGGTASYGYYNPLVAGIARGTDLFGASRADGDGGSNTAFLPTDLMTTHHLISQPTEFVAFTSDSPATIEVFNENKVSQGFVTLTRNLNATGAPYSAIYGSANGQSNHPKGFLYIADRPVHVIYQPKGGGSFASDDDETISLGWNL